MGERLLLKLQGKRILNMEDIVVWLEAKDGRFVVKRFYRELEPRREADFSSKVMMKAWVPPKVRIFA